MKIFFGFKIIMIYQVKSRRNPHLIGLERWLGYFFCQMWIKKNMNLPEYCDKIWISSSSYDNRIRSGFSKELVYEKTSMYLIRGSRFSRDLDKIFGIKRPENREKCKAWRKFESDFGRFSISGRGTLS